MVAEHVPREIVGDEAPPRGAVPLDRVAAVNQVRVPDEDVSLLGQELNRLDPGLLDGGEEPPVVLLVLPLGDEERPAANLEVLAHQIREPVAAGVVVDRAAPGRDVLERDPDRDQIADRLGAHVKEVGVGALLAADEEVHALEEPHLPSRA